MNPTDDSTKQGAHWQNAAERSVHSQFDHTEVARTLKAEYIAAAKDSSMRWLDAVHALLRDLFQPSARPDELAQRIARLVFTQFNLREVSIGLKCQDGLYRYITQHGMRADVWAAHQKLTYTDKELFDPKKYKYMTISKYTRLFLAEDEPYDDDERNTYSAHLSNKSVRRSLRDSKEGDYLDFLILGKNEEILGWIETSGTWDGRIPDARSIRFIEMIASLFGLALSGLFADAAKTKI